MTALVSWKVKFQT